MNELPAVRTNDDYPALMALAKELCTTGFLPVAIKTPAQAVAIILTGRELGLPPMQSLRSICIIQGKPELSADLQLSIFHRDGGRSKWMALDATKATLWLRHPNGDEHTETFTFEDAKRAGLATGMNWQKYPKAMLRSRAITAGLKSIGFEPLTGTYAPGEIGGPEVVEPGTDTVVEPPPADDPPPANKANLKIATANTRARVMELLDAFEGGAGRAPLTGYLRALGWLPEDKEVENWACRFIPITPEELDLLKMGLETYVVNPESVVLPYQPHGLDPGTLKANPVAPAKNGWSEFVIGFGKHKGKKLGALAVPEIEFYFNNFTPRTTVDVQQIDGTIVQQPVPPESVKVQTDLRAMLDIAGKELGFTKEQPK